MLATFSIFFFGSILWRLKVFLDTACLWQHWLITCGKSALIGSLTHLSNCSSKCWLITYGFSSVIIFKTIIHLLAILIEKISSIVIKIINISCQRVVADIFRLRLFKRHWLILLVRDIFILFLIVVILLCVLLRMWLLFFKLGVLLLRRRVVVYYLSMWLRLRFTLRLYLLFNLRLIFWLVNFLLTLGRLALLLSF